MQYYFKRFFVLNSSKVIFSFLIKKSRQKALEIEIAFFRSLGNPKDRTLDHFFYASHVRHNFPYKLIPMAMFTLYRIVKRSVAESVPDRASVHTRTAAFETVSAPEQYCSAPLLKVERSVSDRFLRRSESSLNTFIGAEIATEPRIGK